MVNEILEEEKNIESAVRTQLEKMTSISLPADKIDIWAWKHKVTIRNAELYHNLLQKLGETELSHMGLHTYAVFQEEIRGQKVWTVDMPENEVRIFREKYLSNYKIVGAYYGERYLAIAENSGVIDSDKDKSLLIKRLQANGDQRGIVIDTISNLIKPKIYNN